MAVVMIMEWPEVTRAQYDAVRADLDWVTNKPKGGVMHVAGFDEAKGLRVVDIWESAEDFRTFAAERLTESTRKVGLKTEPKLDFFPVYRLDPLNVAAV